MSAVHAESLGDAPSRWVSRPTAQQRTAVRHALTRLFDDLAPVGAPPRGAVRPAGPVERHRSPHGCILQAAAGAVSVSWFPAPDTDADAEYGELVVIVWSGVVSRPGSAQRQRGGAVVREEFALRPVEVAPTQWVWQRADATVLDGDALAACCRELLERELTR